MSWPVATVGEVCEVVSGATPRTGKPEFWDGNVPWVTPKDLSELGQKHLSDTPRKITKAGLKSCSARMLPAQSVLFSSRAPIGLVAINTIPVCTNQGFKSLVPRFDLVSPDFLFWWLKAQEKHVQSKERGATFKEVSKKIVEDLQIPLPPLPEQKRLAGILDAADALRAKRREALAQLDTLLQSTFLDMFGDPVTNPMGWTKVRSGELFLLPPKIGTITPAAGRGYLVVRVGEVGESRIAFERCGRVEISEKDFAKFRAPDMPFGPRRNDGVRLSLLSGAKDPKRGLQELKRRRKHLTFTPKYAEYITGRIMASQVIHGTSIPHALPSQSRGHGQRAPCRGSAGRTGHLL